MNSDTVTKKDLWNVACVFDPFHLGIVLRELTEIFEPNVKYTLWEILNLAGEIVYSERQPVYMTIEEYNRTTPVWKEKHKTPRVGDKYELLPYKQFKYGKFISPLFYSAITCRGVKNHIVIRMVAEKIFADHDYWFNPLTKRLSYWETCKSEEDKETATYLYNHYMRIKMGVGT